MFITIVLTSILWIILSTIIIIILSIKYKNKSKQLDEQKDEFILRADDKQVIIQGVSHELRSPLAGLIGLIDVYKKRFDNVIKHSDRNNCDKCPHRHDCKHVNRCQKCETVSFLTNVVNDGFSNIEEIVKRINEMVLNLSDSGKIMKENDIKCYDLKPLLKTAVTYSRFAEKSKLVTTQGIKLKGVEKDDTRRCKALALVSPSKFIQIIQNLIMNSVRAVHIKKEIKNPYVNVTLTREKGYHIILIEDYKERKTPIQP